MTDPRVVPLSLQLSDLLLSLQQLLPAKVQLFGQHRKLLQYHKGASSPACLSLSGVPLN